MNFRHKFFIYGTIIVLTLWLILDPDFSLITNLPFGASLIATFLTPTKAIIYLALLHYSRKALMPYLDFETYVNKAKETSEGAGLASISVSIMALSVAIIIYAAVSS